MNKLKITLLTHLATLFVVSQFLVGCHLLQDENSERLQTAKHRQNISLVNYYLWLTTLSESQLTLEYQQLSSPNHEQPVNNSKLMIMHSLPDKPFYKPKQALNEYKQLTTTFTAQDQLLLDLLGRQLELQISLAQTIATAAKKQLKANNQLKMHQATAESLKAENALLQNQITQLKQIENSININRQ